MFNIVLKHVKDVLLLNRLNSKSRHRVVIAITLTAPEWPKSRAYEVYMQVVKHYTSVKPTHIITHCREDNTRVPVFCLNEHPSSAIGYLKYIVGSIEYAMRTIVSMKALGKNSCIIVLWGPIFLPVQLLFSRICTVYLVSLGEWNKVLYWKLYYKHGKKIAKTVEALTSLAEWFALMLSDKVITNTYMVMTRLLGYARGETRLKFQSVSRLPYSHTVQHNNRDVIAYIGRLDYEKGILLALIGYLKYLRRAITNKVAPLVMNIAGTGPLRELVETLTQRVEYIKYKGFLGPEGLSLLYSRTHILVIPSYTEGLPNVIIEAIMFRIPYVLVNRHIWDNIKIVQNLAKKRGVDIIPFSSTDELATMLYNLTTRHKSEHEG